MARKAFSGPEAPPSGVFSRGNAEQRESRQLVPGGQAGVTLSSRARGLAGQGRGAQGQREAGGGEGGKEPVTRDIPAPCHAGPQAWRKRSRGKQHRPRAFELESRAGGGLGADRRRSRRRPRPSLPGLLRSPAPASRVSAGCAALTLGGRCRSSLLRPGRPLWGPVVSDAVTRAARRTARPPRPPQPGAGEPELPGARGGPARGRCAVLCPRLDPRD